MGGFGFFDFEQRCEQLHQLGDPLECLNEAIDWRRFRPILHKVREKERKDNSGRRPWDEVLMFKVLVLQSLYNLSDDQTEYQIRDRISFMRFLGLGLGDRVPDAKTIWLFRNQLAERDLMKGLFERFDRFLSEHGFKAKGGTMVDASLVEIPRQRNSRQENEKIKAGQLPKSFQENPPKARQKDTDARWVQKHGKTHFGYKNHTQVDVKYKLIRDYAVTDAAVHDSQVIESLLGKARTNSNRDVYADSAYRSEAISEVLKKKKLRDRIHRKGYREHPLNERSREANRKKSAIRARIEHVFGRQSQFGEKLMRCIGKLRARNWIGLRNLVYNLDRFARLVT
jgi:IS5 family transposase